MVRFGLNRLDMSSPHAVAGSARHIETLGWDFGFVPSSPLLVQDLYVLLAAALGATERLGAGPLIENPVMRHPAVIASSIATVDRLAPGRALLGLGAGDTAVRLMGRRPARVATLESATRLIRGLLAGERIEVGAGAPARLRHAAQVPVWIAAQGPRTLEMAGRVADGVFLRVGAHPANLRAGIAAVHAGARAAGRDPASVRLGLVLHVVLSDDPDWVARAGRSIAAGYCEYTPRLFEIAGIDWPGPPVQDLKRQVWPDFHHARDLAASGDLVRFLPDAALDAFCLSGSAAAVRDQLEDLLAAASFDIVVPHPVPGPDVRDYARRFAEDVMHRARSV